MIRFLGSEIDNLKACASFNANVVVATLDLISKFEKPHINKGGCNSKERIADTNIIKTRDERKYIKT